MLIYIFIQLANEKASTGNAVLDSREEGLIPVRKIIKLTHQILFSLSLFITNASVSFKLMIIC